MLTDGQIRTAIDSGEIDIEPFSEDQLTPNGYDLAIAEVVLPGTSQRYVEGVVRIPPMTRFMVSTRERVRMGPAMTAQLWLRTTWARRGVLASFGKIDSGFDGTLTFGAFNATADPLPVTIGETFTQMVLDSLSSDAEVLYVERSGHYQDQRGVTMAVAGMGQDAPPVELEVPCLAKGCHECCLETEMPLSREDVVRLTRKGHDARRFAGEEDGFVFLANVDGRCFFLGSDGQCIEYGDRPEGCRLYPLILDKDMAEHMLDEVCPHRGTVVHDASQEKALLELLDRIAKERGSVLIM